MSQFNKNIESNMGLRIPTAAELNTPVAIPTEEIPTILFIMDGSGSMHSMGDEPLNGLKKFVDKQTESGDFLLTLIVFDNTPRIVFDNIDGKDIPTLTKEEHYDAEDGGCTALYDTIAFGINLQKERKPKNVIVVIVTDGLENASVSYNNTQIKEMISNMTEKHKWKFMYLGANQDAFAVGKGLGIHKSAGYDATGKGCGQIFSTISSEISRCISGDVTVEEFNPDLGGVPTLAPVPEEPVDVQIPGGSIGPSIAVQMNEDDYELISYN